MQNNTTRKLVESALMIALATVLSCAKLVDLPYGGSITFASMLPIILLSYRNGLGWGFGSAAVFAVIQQLFGLNNLSYMTGVPAIITLILLDYVVAFTALGLAGVFRKCIPNQSAALVVGTVVVCVVRYGCHVISGATVWAGLSIPTTAALGYSFIYNATYMIPETIITVFTAYYVGAMIDFRGEKLTHIKRETGKSHAPAWLSIYATLLIFAGVVYDVAAVFSKLQDPESGEFSITTMVESNIWIPVLIVTVIVGIVSGVLFGIRAYLNKKNNADIQVSGDAQQVTADEQTEDEQT